MVVDDAMIPNRAITIIRAENFMVLCDVVVVCGGGQAFRVRRAERVQVGREG